MPCTLIGEGGNFVFVLLIGGQFCLLPYCLWKHFCSLSHSLDGFVVLLTEWGGGGGGTVLLNVSLGEAVLLFATRSILFDAMLDRSSPGYIVMQLL